MQESIWRAERQEDEIRSLRMQLEATRSSFSWRITAPVRLLGSVLLALRKLGFEAKLEPPTDKFAYIESNPLVTLQNSTVRNLFRHIVEERLNNDLLSSYYGLGDRVDVYDIQDQRVSREQLVAKIVDFLTAVQENDPIRAAEAFWGQFSFRGKGKSVGVPVEIDSIETAYSIICQKATGVVMIQDLLQQSNLLVGKIIDVGCGSNDFNLAILAQADRIGVRIQKAIGTDIVQATTPRDDPRLEFRKQSSTKTLPIESEYADLVILKWSLHHMTLDEIKAVMLEISRVLRRGGKAIMIEALMGQGKDLYRGFLADCRRKDTWPKGPWQKTRKKITKQYFQLSLNQQKAILALEDYYGHWLEAIRTSMPLPFTYLTSAEIGRHFEAAGMKESFNLRRVFGYAPIIHQGPPSVRLVYEKP